MTSRKRRLSWDLQQAIYSQTIDLGALVSSISRAVSGSHPQMKRKIEKSRIIVTKKTKKKVKTIYRRKSERKKKRKVSQLLCLS